jgi:hypothetical protein
MESPTAPRPITEAQITTIVQRVLAQHAAALAQHHQMALAHAVAALQQQIMAQMQQQEGIGGLGGGVGDAGLESYLIDGGVGEDEVGPPGLDSGAPMRDEVEEEAECERVD